jgi:hypothetical protein
MWQAVKKCGTDDDGDLFALYELLVYNEKGAVIRDIP